MTVYCLGAISVRNQVFFKRRIQIVDTACSKGDAGIISIHSHLAAFQTQQKVIDIDYTKKGSETDPCGTSQCTSSIPEETPLTLHKCPLSRRYDANQASSIPETPYFCIFFNRNHDQQYRTLFLCL